MAPTLVLVHGAWHGPWCWEGLIERLPGLAVRTGFYGDVAPETASAAAGRLGLQSLASVTQPLGEAAWKHAFLSRPDHLAEILRAELAD